MVERVSAGPPRSPSCPTAAWTCCGPVPSCSSPARTPRPHPYRPPAGRARGRPAVRARAAAGAARGARGGAARPAGAAGRAAPGPGASEPSRAWSSALPRPTCCSSSRSALPGSRPEHGVPRGDRAAAPRALGRRDRRRTRLDHPLPAPALPGLVRLRARGAAPDPALPAAPLPLLRAGVPPAEVAARDRLRRPAAPVPGGAGAGRPRPPAGHQPGSYDAQPGSAGQRCVEVDAGAVRVVQRPRSAGPRTRRTGASSPCAPAAVSSA